MADAITIDGITKRFRKSTISREYTTLKTELVNLLLRRKKSDRAHFIEVLKGVTFSIPRGKTVGIIGRNGSGKSTLLKIINGIYAPTSGKIAVNGRISALLELGAGFHPDFSGRENITINGIILGMTRSEIRARIDDIIAFAELGDFIDEPVRTYSSGMYMRLAFAVATHVDPDILVIDEILAVGDAHFSKKSKAKMDEFKTSGRTIVLVTHDLNTVEAWCDLAVWLDAGQVRDVGEPRAVVGHYRRVVAEEEAALAAAGQPTAPPVRQPRTGPPAEAGKRWGTFDLELTSVHLPPEPVRPDDGLQLRLDFQRWADVGAVDFAVSLLRTDGLTLWSTQVVAPASPLPEKGTLELVLESLPLSDGEYRLEVAARGADGQVLDCRRELDRFTVRGDGGGKGMVRIAHQWSLTHPVAADEAPRLVLVSSG
jgi:lipopolysaccharide transport system ATP-binding protein